MYRSRKENGVLQTLENQREEIIRKGVNREFKRKGGLNRDKPRNSTNPSMALNTQRDSEITEVGEIPQSHQPTQSNLPPPGTKHGEQQKSQRAN